jgi:hypothetical protein
MTIHELITDVVFQCHSTLNVSAIVIFRDICMERNHIPAKKRNFCQYYLTNSMKQIPIWEANTHSTAIRGTRRCITLLTWTLGEGSPLHTLIRCIFSVRSILILFSYIRIGTTSSSSLIMFQLRSGLISYHFFFWVSNLVPEAEYPDWRFWRFPPHLW